MARGRLVSGEQIRAIPVTYSGVTFRSTLEGDWACTLDSLGVSWCYEPEAYKLPSGELYRPDFWLPGQHTWLEVKGPHDERYEKYLEFTAALHQDECTRLGCSYSDDHPVWQLEPDDPEREKLMDPVDAIFCGEAPDVRTVVLGRAAGAGWAVLEGGQFLTCCTCGHYTLSPVQRSQVCRVCWRRGTRPIVVPFARVPREGR